MDNTYLPCKTEEEKHQRFSLLPDLITAYLRENPGSQLYKIVEAVAASRGAVTYQLRTMTAKGVVKVHEETGCRRYYLHSFAYAKDRAVLKIFLENKTKAAVIRLLWETPQLSRKDIAVMLGIPENTLYRHITALSNAGILKRERNGHKWLYSIADKTGKELPGINRR